MAALRHSLQRELFSPGEERLVGLVHVTSAGKKKKAFPYFLCVAVTTDQAVGAIIYKVKKNDKNNFYKKKTSWLLKELKLVDGIDGSKETSEFNIQFDKIYHWSASNVQERLLFLSILWKLCSKYLPKQTPMFVNMPFGVIEDSVKPNSSTVLDHEVTVQMDGGIEEQDYQALTDREEKDLERLLSQSNDALSNAEKFMDQLAKDLSLLDGANIQSLMGSEAQIVQLLNLLEAAENEAATIEMELDRYDNILLQARVSMTTVGEKNVSLETANRNNRLLLTELNNLVAQLDIPHNQQVTLNNPDLTSPTGLQNAIQAAKSLQRALNADLKPGLEKMVAVQDQRRQLEKWRAKFMPTVTRQLNNLFIHLSNDSGETSSQSSRSSNSSQTTVSLAKHGKLHSQLQMYAPLMHWLKATDPACYEKLLEVYTTSICKLYERDLRQFFDEARSKVLGLREKKLRGSDSGSELGARHSLSIKNQTGTIAGGGSPSGAVQQLPSQNLLGNERDLWMVEVDIHERKRLEDLLECALAELEPVCLVEQEFCVAFFALDQGSQEPDESSPTIKTPERSINEEVRKMMSVLFAVLEVELVSFLATYEKVDSFSPLYVLVRLSQHVLSATDTGSFLSVTFGSSLVHVKRAFDRFFMTQLRSIEDSKQPRKTKCGILPFISNFEEFSVIIENIFKNSERRIDVDKWYTRLVRAMFDVVPRIAVENSRTPADVIKMENYHRLHALLSQLKISVLEAERKEAKQRYQEALQSYVIQYFGRPLEKLNLFFDGVQAKVAQGVKESEIGYQMMFSKQELRKVISNYPGREVKKGLESLYKKVEKHLSDEGNLLQVVWRAMQEEFIRQYKSLEDMIQRCYPGALITLDFSMSDILEYFSDIARSH